jgi:hypothetical protein
MTARYGIEFTATTPTGEQGAFVNYAWHRDQVNQLRLVRAAITTSEYPAVNLNKTLASDHEVDNETGSKLVAPQTPVTVEFTITNTGTEPLFNLVFQDETLVGPPVTNITFAMVDIASVQTDDGITTITFSPTFTLNPGESITGTGQLVGLAASDTHHNVATVTGQGTVTEATVGDEDELIVVARWDPPPMPPLPATGGAGTRTWWLPAMVTAAVGLPSVAFRRRKQLANNGISII